LDTLVYERATQKLNTLNIGDYMQELKSISWTMAPPPKVHMEKAKFVPPEISK